MENVVHVPSTAVAQDNTDVAVDASPDGVELLPANPNRRSALIINTGDNSMRVTTDGSLPSQTHGKLVQPGAALSLSSPDCPTDVVLAKSTTGGTTANASEVS